MEIIGYSILVLSGITLALIGGGGSLLSTPVLIYFFKMNALQATTYSLFVVAVGSAYGTFSSIKNKFIDIPLAIEFALPCFVSIFLVRSYGVVNIPQVFDAFFLKWTRDIAIMLPFGVVMVTSALKGIRKKRIEEISVGPSKPAAIIQGLFVGALTGFVGVGGGFLITPILHFVMGLDFKKAIGTSLFVLMLNSSFGFSVDLIRGAEVSFKLISMFAAASVLGLMIGFRLSKQIEEAKIKMVFSIVLVIVSFGILADYTYKLIALNI